MSLKNYIFSSINTKGGQDSDKFATIRFKSLKSMDVKNGDGVEAGKWPTLPASNDAAIINTTTTTELGKCMAYIIYTTIILYIHEMDRY